MSKEELRKIWQERLDDAKRRLQACIAKGPCSIGTYDARADVARYMELVESTK